MADASAHIAINIEGDVFVAIRELQAQFTDLTGRVDQLDDSVKHSFNTISNEAKKANQALHLLAWNAVSELTQNFGTAFRQGTQGVYDFDASLKELSAITGVVDGQLAQIGRSARQTARDFGGDAARNLRSYTVLLSKVSPEIAKNPEALAMMGEQVTVLSKTMGGDTVGAVNALSSAMNQFNVDLSDPVKAAGEMEKMMNMMAAAAQAGSQEVPNVAAALDGAGAIAKSAGLSFAETNAAIQVLGKYGKEGAEGGVALRNVLSIMQREEFLPDRVREQLQAAGVNINLLADKSLSLQERLRELKKIAGDDALLSGMFGMQNTVAIKGLLEQTDLLRQFEKQIESNTTAARDMAAVIGESYRETKSRIMAWFEDIKLTMFSFTGDLLPWMDVTIGGMLGIIGFMPGIIATAHAFKMLAASQKLQALWTNIASAATAGYTLVVKGLNYAFLASPIGWIVAGLGAVTAAVLYAWNHFEGFRAAVMGIWEAVKQVFSNIASFIGEMLRPFFDAVGFIMEGEWGKAARALGQGLLNVAASQLKFVGRLFSGEITEGVADAYEKGAEKGRLSFAQESETDRNKTPAPDTNDTASQYEDFPLGGTTAGQSSRTASSSQAGSAGSAVRNNNIRIESLVGQIIIHEVTSIDQLKHKIRNAVNEALIAAVRDTEVAIS